MIKRQPPRHPTAIPSTVGRRSEATTQGGAGGREDRSDDGTKQTEVATQERTKVAEVRRRVGPTGAALRGARRRSARVTHSLTNE